MSAAFLPNRHDVVPWEDAVFTVHEVLALIPAILMPLCHCVQLAFLQLQLIILLGLVVVLCLEPGTHRDMQSLVSKGGLSDKLKRREWQMKFMMLHMQYDWYVNNHI